MPRARRLVSLLWLAVFLAACGGDPSRSNEDASDVEASDATDTTRPDVAGDSAAADADDSPDSATRDTGDDAPDAPSDTVPPAIAVVTAILVNADTDADLGPLTDGMTVDLDTLGTSQLNVRAELEPPTGGSVRFVLDGAPVRTENNAPYALAGDDLHANGDVDYLPWTPAAGSHTLVLAPFTGPDASGEAGPERVFRFTVVAGAASCPPGYTDVNGDGSVCLPPTGTCPPTATSSEVFDFVNGVYTEANLNTSTYFIRSVFSLDIPAEMQRIASGLRLVFDASALPAGYLDYSNRSELRETDNTAYPATDTTQIYRLQFSVEEDFATRYGPGTIIQRFNKSVDGPDCEVEKTSIAQFSGDDDTPYLQTVCFGQRVKHPGVYLQPKNELLMVIYNSATDGEFGIWLNGVKLDGRAGIDTLPSTSGTWLQFGLYEHGMIYDHEAARADQVASGSYRASYVYHRFEKLTYAGKLDFSTLASYDPNAVGYQCN